MRRKERELQKPFAESEDFSGVCGGRYGVGRALGGFEYAVAVGCSRSNEGVCGCGCGCGCDSGALVVMMRAVGFGCE